MDELTDADNFDGEDFAERDGFLSDLGADADALASAGWGTDEDYGGGMDSPTDFDEHVMNEDDCAPDVDCGDHGE